MLAGGKFCSALDILDAVQYSNPRKGESLQLRTCFTSLFVAHFDFVKVAALSRLLQLSINPCLPQLGAEKRGTNFNHLRLYAETTYFLNLGIFGFRP